MKILLATGIYPPDIGGPATYVRALSEELLRMGEDVRILTYSRDTQSHGESPVSVTRVSKSGFFLTRWMRYAAALREQGKDVDIVYCFSSVSCGAPLLLSHLRGPKRVLRLGGDFAWERYTDLGGRSSLRAFQSSLFGIVARLLLWPLLYSFHCIVFSTSFQRELSRRWFTAFPNSVVIENAISAHGSPLLHKKHDPLKLLFVGRFVRFKNLFRLLHSVAGMPHAALTLVGDGPLRQEIIDLGRSLQLQGRIAVLSPQNADDLRTTFDNHDVLVLPSLTEISPNVALEARSAGLPVLLTQENGLSSDLLDGMSVQPLLSVMQITKAILSIDHDYDQAASMSASPVAISRGWDHVATETLHLFAGLRFGKKPKESI